RVADYSPTILTSPYYWLAERTWLGSHSVAAIPVFISRPPLSKNGHARIDSGFALFTSWNRPSILALPQRIRERNVSADNGRSGDRRNGCFSQRSEVFSVKGLRGSIWAEFDALESG